MQIVAHPPVDILGLGAVAVDDLLYVAQFPPANHKTRVMSEERQCGGLTATALVAAARLGARCAYAGALGEDPLSGFALDALAAEHIDLTHLARRAGARPVHSMIIVGAEGATRNIFPRHAEVEGAARDWPPESVILAARVLFVDHVGIDGQIRAAQVARAARIPVVADVEHDSAPRFAELLGLADHLILSRDFALRLTGAPDAPAALRTLTQRDSRAFAAVTCGEAGSWWVDGADPAHAQHTPAYPVEAVDTTGCGDVFHGAYAFGLARGLPPAERVRIASAAAALKATRRGGQAGAPVWDELARFLSRNG